MLVKSIAFVPPSIENREVQYTVHLGFFAGCTGSLERTGRRVQPDVDTGNKTFCNNHIVILEEDNLAEEFRATADFNNTLNQILTGAVGGVCFAGKNKLYGELRIVYNLGKTVQIGEQQVRAFVCGEAACKTYDKSVGVDTVHNIDNCGGIALMGKPFFLEIAAQEVDELVLESYTHLPDFFVGNFKNTLPGLGVALICKYLLAEFFGIEFLPFGSGPRWHVNAIGNVTYMTFLP